MGAAWLLWPMAARIVKRTEGVHAPGRRKRVPVSQLPYPNGGPSFRVSFQPVHRPFEPAVGDAMKR
jgi:hypothetical protein